MNNWERMKAGRLYNADSKDLEQYHKFGMETCDKFNRTPLWMKKRKQRLLEKLIPSAKDGGAAIFAPFYCEYGVNIHFGKGCLSTINVHFGLCADYAGGWCVGRRKRDDCNPVSSVSFR